MDKKSLSLPITMPLSRILTANPRESMTYTNSFLENEKRCIPYRKYCKLMERNRIKTKVEI